MFYSYFLSASALAAVSLGAVLYTVTGHGEGMVEGAQAPTGHRFAAAPGPFCPPTDTGRRSTSRRSA